MRSLIWAFIVRVENSIVGPSVDYQDEQRRHYSHNAICTVWCRSSRGAHFITYSFSCCSEMIDRPFLSLGITLLNDSVTFCYNTELIYQNRDRIQLGAWKIVIIKIRKQEDVLEFNPLRANHKCSWCHFVFALFFTENKAWHFMLIVCYSHETRSRIFSEKKK